MPKKLFTGSINVWASQQINDLSCGFRTMSAWTHSLKLTPMLNWRLHVFLSKTLVKTSWDTRKLAQRHTLLNELIFYLLTLSLPECNEILWCGHSNESSLPVLSHSAICFSKCYKMKFCKLGRHLPLATFGSERVKKAWVCCCKSLFLLSPSP